VVDVLRQLADIASGRKAKGTIDRAFCKKPLAAHLFKRARLIAVLIFYGVLGVV
jgi:hypothetical protein